MRGGGSRIVGLSEAQVTGREMGHFVAFGVFCHELVCGRESQGMRGGVRVWRVVACVTSWRCVRVLRSWLVEVGFAFHRSLGSECTDVCPYLVRLFMGGGARTLQGLGQAHTPGDSVTGVVAAHEALWYCVRWAIPCSGACFDLPVGSGDDTDPARMTKDRPAPPNPLG